MLLQVQIQREAEAPFRQPPRAAMAGRAALGKQLWRRLARIEIFLRCYRRAGQKEHCGEREQAATRWYWRHQFIPARERGRIAASNLPRADGEKWAADAYQKRIMADAARASSSWLPRDDATRAPPRSRPCSRRRARFARPGKWLRRRASRTSGARSRGSASRKSWRSPHVHQSEPQASPAVGSSTARPRVPFLNPRSHFAPAALPAPPPQFSPRVNLRDGIPSNAKASLTHFARVRQMPVTSAAPLSYR